jgi:hypothetical protein
MTSVGLPDFDDEPTIIQVRDVGEAPPPLPFPLRRAKRHAAERWLEALPLQAREILESARQPAESWPRRSRVPGAIAVPLAPIPSLVRRA